MKYVPGPPQEQCNGLYWENERLIHEANEELRLLSERRIASIKLFRVQEDNLKATLFMLMEKKAIYDTAFAEAAANA